MTSGTFVQFPINQIFVDRETRQRKDISPSDIKKLAKSIAAVGLINPPVIQKDGQLRAGETRWMACRSLGWTAIPVQFVEDLDEAQLQLLELDENIKRKNLTWQEECEAVARYHKLRQQTEPTWNSALTADALGMSASDVSRKLAVHSEMARPESKVHNATKLSEATTIVTRLNKRRAESVIATLKDEPLPESRPVPLLNANFHKWAADYSGPKFNVIHCDFPYGINADNQQQGGNVGAFGSYTDSEDVYWDLIKTLSSAMENVVAPSAHLMFWFSPKFYAETKTALTMMGWKVDDFPLFWHKSDNAGLLPDPRRGGRRTYELAFFASRGDRFIVEPVSNSISAPSTKKIHMSEKPLAVLRHFFRMIVDEHSIVLDPTCGSGNAARAATMAGANSVLGVERDPDFFKLAKEHFYDLD